MKTFREHQQDAVKARWAKMSPEERSATMKLVRKKGLKKKNHT